MHAWVGPTLARLVGGRVSVSVNISDICATENCEHDLAHNEYLDKTTAKRNWTWCSSRISNIEMNRAAFLYQSHFIFTLLLFQLL